LTNITGLLSSAAAILPGSDNIEHIIPVECHSSSLSFIMIRIVITWHPSSFFTQTTGPNGTKLRKNATRVVLNIAAYQFLLYSCKILYGLNK